jgi:FtsZ-binding cell division protein ZapB
MTSCWWKPSQAGCPCYTEVAVQLVPLLVGRCDLISISACRVDRAVELGRVPDAASAEQLVEENAALRAENADLRSENAALRTEHDELKRMFVVVSERVAELERRLASDSSNSCPAAVVGCAVVEEAGEEALVADQVGTQAR